VQPPFYVPTADAVVNYCTIGAVIGHEMTHGFDSTGRQFDANGNLRDWWTPGASAQFQQRTGVLVQQYSSFEVLPGVKHNGALTVTDNSADLGGITLARAALQRQLGGQPAPVVDGLTGDQRCFVAWAQILDGQRPGLRGCRRTCRPTRMRLNAARAVQPLLHLDAFHQAFGIRPATRCGVRPKIVCGSE
jgi:putative endopeptidase